MQPTKYSEYKIPARNIAEAMWGTDGTISYRTNRHGAYYYSCSAHGGYVVDGRALTDDERSAINQYIKPTMLDLLIQETKEGFFVVGASIARFTDSGRARTPRYDPRKGPAAWEELPIYLFEEDCAFSVLEMLTDIRAKGAIGTEESIAANRKNIFERYYAQPQPLST